MIVLGVVRVSPNTFWMISVKHNTFVVIQSWTLQEDEKAKEMWKIGKSAREIGRALKRTRNSVIGRMHRLGIKGERPAAPKTINPIRKRKPTKTASKPQNAHNSKPKEPNLEKVQYIPASYEPGKYKKILMEVTYKKHCSFIVEGTGAEAIYCGAPTGGHAYCNQHHKIIFLQIPLKPIKPMK